MVTLKYLSHFWKTFENSLINCEINFILIWSVNCVIVYTNIANQSATFATTKTKLYVPVVILSTQDNPKLLQQLISSFSRIINWNKYLSKPELLTQNLNSNHLVEPTFHGVNRPFVLTVEDDAQRSSTKIYYLPNVKIKNYNVLIDGKMVFDQLVKINKVIYEHIRKNTTGQGGDYKAGCLLICAYFRDNYKTIAIDLSKQQALNADYRSIQQINFSANLDRANNKRMSFIAEEVKETVLDFSQGTVKLL